MEWTGEGLIIGARRHGETSVIVEAMVAGRGRCLGLVRGGRSRKQAAVLQPGNSVALTWRARLEDHLGMFNVELLNARAAGLIENRLRLYAFQLLADHLRLLPERDPHDTLFAEALDIIDIETDLPDMGVALTRFEMLLLDELGFGLDLTACAVTGQTSGLTHVSPRSGRAVTRAAAGPYLERLFELPAFLVGELPPEPGDIGKAFRLTGHFLHEHVWAARNIPMPSVREALIAAFDGL